MQKCKWSLICCCLSVVIYISCKRDPQVQLTQDEQAIIQQALDIPAVPYNYSSPELPAFFGEQFVTIQNNTPPGNPQTDWGATLGRVLFYDTRLSANSSISCSSCHMQEFGFTDTAVFSKGFNGGLTKRHSMSLLNAVYYISGRFFWDERAGTLEQQVLFPIQDSVEMGMNLDTLVSRLKAAKYYPILFRYAFGSSEINSDRIARALAQYVRSIVSYRSKYDQGRAVVGNRLDPFPNFTQQENDGKAIFMGSNLKKIDCSGCHKEQVMILDNPRNNGVSLSNDDAGVFIHTQNARDLGSFKAPSLKSVALRKNYMHSGNLHGLDAVINHYNSNIQPNPNLDPHLFDDNTGLPFRMGLGTTEIAALKAFLETLTDVPLLTDKKFSNPFR